MNKIHALASVSAALLAMPAYSQIQITITPNGAGSTLWTFSGSATYSAVVTNSKFVNQSSFNAASNTAEWKTGTSTSNAFGVAYTPTANYVTPAYNDFNVSNPGGGATITIGGTSYTIDGVLVDNDSSGDDIGIFISGSTSAVLSPGTTVALSGSKAFAVDYSNLIPGSYPFSYFDDSGTLSMNLTVVPEPGEWALLTGTTLCVTGFILRRRRQA